MKPLSFRPNAANVVQDSSLDRIRATNELSSDEREKLLYVINTAMNAVV